MKSLGADFDSDVLTWQKAVAYEEYELIENCESCNVNSEVNDSTNGSTTSNSEDECTGMSLLIFLNNPYLHCMHRS